MNATSTPKRCRIVLIAPPGGSAGDFDRRLGDALSGGDVASILLPAYDLDDQAFQAFAERIVPLAKKAQDRRQ
jgi:thiamine-phosphate pyrophosphorylase